MSQICNFLSAYVGEETDVESRAAVADPVEQRPEEAVEEVG